eukprot:c21245_g2_i1 orf=376-1212(+)
MLDISAENRGSVLEEHDYIGLRKASSVTAMMMNTSSKDAKGTLEDADLRLDLGLGLGLGTGFTKKESEGEFKDSVVPKQSTSQLEVNHASSMSGIGSSASNNWMKRGYSETMAMPAPKNTEADAGSSKQTSFLSTWAPPKPTIPAWCSGGLEKPAALAPPKPLAGKLEPHASTGKSQDAVADDAPPSKERVVGWPPVRSYRRHTLAKPAENFVKVNMDGITVGRKVDLNAYTSYESLLLALEEMFQPSNAQGGLQAPLGRDYDMKHFLLSSGSDFVLT